MCCICLESATQGDDGQWRATKCRNADWGSLCGADDKKVNCFTYKGRSKEHASCNPTLNGLQCREKQYLFMASDDKKNEKRCLLQDCYSKGSDVPTNTSIVGQCSPTDKDDKKMLCDMARSVATVLAQKKAPVSYTWIVPKNDVTDGGEQCPAPGSDAFNSKAGTIYKIVASKDGVVAYSQTFPDTKWVKEPNLCGRDTPAAPSARKTITMNVFTASWCGPCQKLKAALQSEKARLAKDGITLNIIEHDIDSARGREVAKRFRIDISKIPVSAMGNASGGMDRVNDAISSIKQAEQRIKAGK